MSLSTLNNLILKVVEFYGSDTKLNFLWHGGEPLLMGLDFFQGGGEHSEVTCKESYDKEYHAIKRDAVD